jgi:hypothetical protein
MLREDNVGSFSPAKSQSEKPGQSRPALLTAIKNYESFKLAFDGFSVPGGPDAI